MQLELRLIDAQKIVGYFGLQIVQLSEEQKYGYTYKYPVITLAWDDEPWFAIHELAHFLVASPYRRRRINYGLGESPAFQSKTRVSRDLESFEIAEEEEKACYVGTYLLREFGFCSQEMELNVGFSPWKPYNVLDLRLFDDIDVIRRKVKKIKKQYLHDKNNPKVLLEKVDKK